MTTTNERDLYYARRLAEMIRCKTVSRKEGFEPEEFLKLRRVIGTLFPLVTEKAERTILGEDAYLYKLPGKDPGRNVLLMSHHDVVEATGSWQEAPFAGVIRGGKLWGRGTVDTHAAENPSCLCFTGEAEKLGVPCVEYGREGDGADQAKHIFRSLRALDEQGDAVVYARCPQKDGLSMAVYNRLIRAAAFRVIKL